MSFRLSIPNLHHQAWHKLVIVVELIVGWLGLEVRLITKLLEQRRFKIIKATYGHIGTWVGFTLECPKEEVGHLELWSSESFILSGLGPGKPGSFRKALQKKS